MSNGPQAAKLSSQQSSSRSSEAEDDDENYIIDDDVCRGNAERLDASAPERIPSTEFPHGGGRMVHRVDTDGPQSCLRLKLQTRSEIRRSRHAESSSQAQRCGGDSSEAPLQGMPRLRPLEGMSRPSAQEHQSWEEEMILRGLKEDGHRHQAARETHYQCFDGSAAEAHMRGMTAAERSERRDLEDQMLDLLRQLKPETDVEGLQINPDYIAFAETRILRDWITLASATLRQRSAETPADDPGSSSDGREKTGRGVCSPSSLSLRARVSRGSPPLKSVESRTGAVPLQSTMNEHIINLRVVLQVCLPPAARALCTPRWLAEVPPGRAGVRGAPRVGASTAREADGLLPAGCSSWSRSRHRALQDHEVHPAEEAHGVLLRAQELADGPDPL